MSLTGSPTSVDPVHPWLATAGGSQQQMNNTVGVKTERQFVKNEASTASPRHGSKLRLVSLIFFFVILFKFPRFFALNVVELYCYF